MLTALDLLIFHFPLSLFSSFSFWFCPSAVTALLLLSSSQPPKPVFHIQFKLKRETKEKEEEKKEKERKKEERVA
jgi:hypothetical protein